MVSENQKTAIGLDVKLSMATRDTPLLVGGADIGYLSDNQKNAIASYVVYAVHIEDKKTIFKKVYSHSKGSELKIAYKAGFLGLREADPIVEAINVQRLTEPEMTPSVILCDGNGILHPKRNGLACHVGRRTSK